MARTPAGSYVALVGLILACAACSGASDAPAGGEIMPSPEEHRMTVEAWRAKHEADYRRDYVTIAGLLPLREGVNTVGSASSNDLVLPASVPDTVGRFVLTDGRVRFEPRPGVDIRLRDEPVTAPIDLQSDASSEADHLQIGAVSMVVHMTGTTPMLRVRDPNGPWARDFRGFSWFPIDQAYVVVGRFLADEEPQRIDVPNTFGDLDEFTTEGVVEFTLLGETLRLRPFTTRPNRFWFVFRDASAGEETYEAARFLYADLLPDGRVVLDFNQAYNPPCAFNPYTTCPIPLRENRLPVKILAGERAYPVRIELPVSIE